MLLAPHCKGSRPHTNQLECSIATGRVQLQISLKGVNEASCASRLMPESSTLAMLCPCTCSMPSHCAWSIITSVFCGPVVRSANCALTKANISGLKKDANRFKSKWSHASCKFKNCSLAIVLKASTSGTACWLSSTS